VYQYDANNFDKWFRDVSGTNKSAPLELTLTYDEEGGVYVFQDDEFFPIDNRLFGNQTEEVHSDLDHNYHFTLQLHTKFTFIPADVQYFRLFKSDDDLWVFIDKKLVIDMGGLHNGRCGKFAFTSAGDAEFQKYEDNDQCIPLGEPCSITLGLQSGETYDFDLFFAERHTHESKLQFSTNIELESTFTLGDYHLQSCSPCIDAGDSNAVPAGITTDLDGSLRFFDDPNTDDTGTGTEPIVDMGAYEYQTELAAEADDDSYELYCTESLTTSAAEGVLANDTDENFDNLTAELVQDVSHGTLTLDANGAFEYTPDFEFVGQDWFVYHANDGQTCSNDANVIISVYPPVDAEAGEYEPIRLPENTVDLIKASVTGGNPNASLNIQWSVADNGLPPTGKVDFKPATQDWDETSSQLNPTVRFYIDPNIFAGTEHVEFALKLSADDGTVSDEAYVVITVMLAGDPNIQSGPQVDAGEYPTQHLPVKLALDGTVTDDGRPYGWLIKKWSVVRSPNDAIVSFEEADSEDTEVSFNAEGQYVLKLWAWDGKKSNEDTATIQVDGAGNSAPYVNAGPDKQIDPLSCRWSAL